MSEEKIIYVYDHFSAFEPQLLGKLYVNALRGNETYSFEFEDSWLENTNFSIPLDPDLIPYGGRQFHSGKGLSLTHI